MREGAAIPPLRARGSDMTRYSSRSVIPGRPKGAADGGSDMDRMVFGDGGGAANDEIGDDEIPLPTPKRRKGRRANDDFRPLPGQASHREQPENKRAPIVLIGAILTIGVFGWVVWSAYSDGVRPQDAAATPELADAGPFKARPATPETTRTTPEQATVFERTEAKPKETTDVASTPDVRPEPKAPVKTAVVVAPPVTPPPATPPQASVVPPPPAKAAVVTTAVAAPATPAPATPAVAKPATPAPEPVKAAVQTTGDYKPVFSAGGNFVAQVAAAQTEEGATTEWNRRKKAMPDLFASAEKIVVRADVNGRTVYRVRVGSFATAADAEAFCSAVKARNGDCFRTSK
jgi:hypothetical protein